MKMDVYRDPPSYEQLMKSSAAPSTKQLKDKTPPAAKTHKRRSSKSFAVTQVSEPTKNSRSNSLPGVDQGDVVLSEISNNDHGYKSKRSSSIDVTDYNPSLSSSIHNTKHASRKLSTISIPENSEYISGTSQILSVPSLTTNTNLQSSFQNNSSPLTESICIHMLNEESFTSTSTFNNTLGSDTLGASFLSDDTVFSDADYDLENDKTVVEREDVGLHVSTSIKQDSDSTNYSLDPGVKPKIPNFEAHNLTSSSGEQINAHKDMSCDQLEKEQFEDLLNSQITTKTKPEEENERERKKGLANVANCSRKDQEVECNLFVVNEEGTSSGEINPVFLHDKIIVPSLQINDSYPLKKQNKEPHKEEDTPVWKTSNSHIVITSKPVPPALYKKEELELEPRPKDYLLFSCLVLVCCVNPLALFSLLLSLNVNTAYDKGNYRQSRKLSRASFWLSTVAVFLTMAIIVTILIVFWPDHSFRSSPQQEVN